MKKVKGACEEVLKIRYFVRGAVKPRGCFVFKKKQEEKRTRGFHSICIGERDIGKIPFIPGWHRVRFALARNLCFTRRVPQSNPRKSIEDTSQYATTAPLKSDSKESRSTGRKQDRRRVASAPKQSTHSSWSCTAGSVRCRRCCRKLVEQLDSINTKLILSQKRGA